MSLLSPLLLVSPNSKDYLDWGYRLIMRILAVADAVSPVVYSENFPKNLPPFDLILSAGDFPGHVLEFIATKQTLQPIYVLGNHGNAYIRDAQSDEVRLPGGCLNAHMKVIDYKGILIVGIEGSGRYRPGDHQYTEAQYSMMVARLAPKLALNKLTKGRAVDILLTHAPLRVHMKAKIFLTEGFRRLIAL